MKRLESIIANIFGIVFLVLSIVVTVETIARKVFNYSLQGADELGGYALAVGGVLSFTLALIGRNHIRVDVFHELFPRRIRAGLNWLSIVLLAGLALTLVLICSKVLRETVEFGSTAQTPWATPLIYPQAVWYAGLVMFMLVALFFAGRASWLLFTGQLDELNVEFHPKSAKEELKEELEDLEHRSSVSDLAPGPAAIRPEPRP